MSNFYLISFDHDKTDASALNEVIKNNPAFITWWHYLSSTYIVKTDLSLKETNAYIVEKWPNSRHLIIEVNPSNYDGWLTRDAFNWFIDNTNPTQQSQS